MKIEPVHLQWSHPEMLELFNKLTALRDDVWEQCRTELGDDLPDCATATEIAGSRIVRDHRRRVEIIESYRMIARSYERKMADLVMRYTVPQVSATERTY